MKAKKVTLIISLLVVIIVGVLSRYFQTGILIFDKYLGDALYTIMFYLLLSLTWVRGSVVKKASFVMLFMTALELFQLTQIPYHLSTRSNIFFRIVAILLGTKFGWLDLMAYLIGVILIVIVDTLFSAKFPETPKTI